MKIYNFIFALSLLFVSTFTQAQRTSDWMKTGAVLDIFHAITGPHAARDSVIAFLNEEYMPVVTEAFPETRSFHLEGIAGDRKGQHAKFWIFASVAVRDSYFPKAGGRPTKRYLTHNKEMNRKYSYNKMVELFRGWDYSFKTDWEIVGKTPDLPGLNGLRGIEMDVHYLARKPGMSKKKLAGFLVEKLAAIECTTSQFFVIHGDRDTRKNHFAVLELHQPGQSQRDKIANLDLLWEPKLYSSYRIW